MPPALIVPALVVLALTVSRISGFVMRRAVRRIAERGGDANGRWWRAGAVRIGLESADASEQRRRQRIDAAARMLNHVASLVIWIGFTIAVFHLLDIDAAFFLSSAGFVGAGVAIGGQHKVNDYLTGLSVLFEDRYGVGDELVVDVGGHSIHAVVDNIGLVTTRLRDERSTLHVPNAQLLVVRNLSQEAATSTVRLRLPDDVDLDDLGIDAERDAADALRNLAGTENLTDLVFIGDLSAQRTPEGGVDVAVRTIRPLDDRARSVLVERAEHALGAGR